MKESNVSGKKFTALVYNDPSGFGSLKEYTFRCKRDWSNYYYRRCKEMVLKAM